MDSENHTGLAWSWSDHGAGGTFLPSASVQNPSYVAPSNAAGSPITLTVTGICEWYWPWVTASHDTTLVLDSPHSLTVHAQASTTQVASGASLALTATYADTLGHTGQAWTWSDNGAGGAFTPSANVQNPTYTAPINHSGQPLSVTLTVTGICEWFWPWITAQDQVVIAVRSG